MHHLARTAAFVLSLLVAFELMAAQLLPRPVLMPTEQASLAYHHELQDTQLPLLTQLAERIRTPQEADDAVYELAGYIRSRAEAFRKLSMEPLSPAQATERFQHILDAEAELMQSDAATALRREDERLRATDFYHSATLRALWECYVTRRTPPGPRLPWMPTGEQAMKRLFLPTTDAEMTLLALDAFAAVGFRGDHAPESLFAVPAAPKLRGNKESFENCFCPRYCFGVDATPAPKALSGTPAEWAASSPRALLALTPQTARTLPTLQEERRTAYGALFFYRLTPPFRSPYLVIIMPKDGEHPASFIFTEDLSEFSHAPAGDAT